MSVRRKIASSTARNEFADMVNRAKARKILELRGSGLWEGDVAEMRRDTSKARTRKSV